MSVRRSCGGTLIVLGDGGPGSIGRTMGVVSDLSVGGCTPTVCRLTGACK